MPEYVLRRLTTEYKGTLKRHDELNNVSEKRLFPVDAIYITPESPHQLAMMPDLSIQIELEKGVDALYVTRLQKERMTVDAEQQDPKNDYLAVDKKLLKEKEFKRTLVMHPLPRVDELAHELDTDPRSMYFRQAALGVPVRMALIALLLGVKRFDLQPGDKSPAREIIYPVYKREVGTKCHNPKCVTIHEKYPIEPEFRIVSQQPLTLRCVYCEQEKFPQYIASTDWHEGTLESKRYHHADSHWLKKIKTENLLIFDSEEEALANGFKPSKYAAPRLA
jgi:hypothetical protein